MVDADPSRLETVRKEAREKFEDPSRTYLKYCKEKLHKLRQQKVQLKIKVAKAAWEEEILARLRAAGLVANAETEKLTVAILQEAVTQWRSSNPAITNNLRRSGPKEALMVQFENILPSS